MTLTIDAGPHGASVSEADVLTELAIVLYQREKLSIGWAARLAGMNRWAFNSLLADRDVPMHYDSADLQRDLATLENLFGR
jgi:predicted HTH domain antitoxin